MKQKIVNIRPGTIEEGRHIYLYAEVHEEGTNQLICTATLDYILQTRVGQEQVVNYADALEAYIEFNNKLVKRLVEAEREITALYEEAAGPDL